MVEREVDEISMWLWKVYMKRHIMSSTWSEQLVQPNQTKSAQTLLRAEGCQTNVIRRGALCESHWGVVHG
jgi:hypothetical protein